jgi:hypothetical protein
MSQPKIESSESSAVIVMSCGGAKSYECKQGHAFEAVGGTFVIQFAFGATVLKTETLCPYCLTRSLNESFGATLVGEDSA